jgi:ABC-2 type transport system permease protein
VKHLLVIAGAEWRYWQRSRLALGGALLMAVLLAATTVLTTLRMQGEAAERAHHQAAAETAFLGQPDRHPHRMVHYGHYVFRTPAPLALFDPGLDPVTGQSIFLEGHRQNTAMFAASDASADLGGFSWLSPAMVYQLFGPLLVILLGHGLITREREAATLATLLAQGTSGRMLLAGKALALLSFVVVLLLPLALSAGLAVHFSAHPGEQPMAAMALVGAYLLYLSIWGALALLASALFRRRSTVLATLATLWIALTLVLPAVAVSVAANAAPMASKLETDLTMLADLRKLGGDGHNASDPAFAQLRADLLAKHGVQRVEELPVNLRGVVAQVSEQRLTDTLNTYARAQMAAQTRQAAVLARHGWLTPLLAVADASRALAGTDLAHHHRFLREAEALRYAFVQGLNRVHAQKLAYSDDIRRSSDAQAERRTRVDAANWQLLDRFRFEPDTAVRRINQARPQWLMLGVWCALLVAAGFWAGGRLKP